MGEIKRVAAAGFLYTSCAPVGTENLFSHSYKISCASYTEQPDFAYGKFPVFVTLQPTKSACSATTENGLSGVGQPPFPASAVAKGITHYTLQAKSCAKWNSVPFGYPCQRGQRCFPFWISYANRDAARPYWKPRAKGGFAPSGRYLSMQ